MGKASEQSRFVERELLGGFAEVVLGGGFESVGAVAEEDLVGIEREDLRLGKTALDLDGEPGLLNLALERAIGGEEEIARELHGESRGALHAPAGFDVAIRRAENAPDIDAPVSIEIFVFDGNEGVAKDGRVIVVGSDHAALKGEGTDDAAMVVVEFGDGAGAVVFEIVDLREVGGIDEKKAHGSADQGGKEGEEAEEHAADELSAFDFNRRMILVKRTHRRIVLCGGFRTLMVAAGIRRPKSDGGMRAALASILNS